MARYSTRNTRGRFARVPPGPLSAALFAYLTAYEVNFLNNVDDIVREFAKDLEAYAQTNASWSDRTGEARAGLTAAVHSDPLNPKIYLYHTVPYGLWLEVRWSGKYAIIMPSIEAMGPELMRRLGK